MARPAANGGGWGEGGKPPGFVPVIDMARGHARMLEACDMLEKLADDLPARVDRLRCLMLANSLPSLVEACHRFEEQFVFPAFAVSSRNAAIVSRLMAEHVQDRCAAEDLSEALLAYGEGRPIANPEAFGYMLRALFDSMRRHIAFEQDCILSALPGEG
ncbi:hemerythrin domain-containing protein [Bosea sp. (in: a-proteobacteria)]|uniref:hemerythrin domain-containing protein n=1 Tax=Bosea sp. (in: a-proteobacteria) TaxID=1871050 RepID=UPI0025C63A57|nr:hemerythrin domain-containing protein [Bosea sp. (in: a-proteobacteria)]